MKQMIHINDCRIDVIRHLNSQTNKSGYIVQLIKKDMENQLLTKEDIINLIKQYSGDPGISFDLLDSIESCED